MFIKNIKSITRPSHLGGGQWEVMNLKPLTFVMGKNGCGKTTLMNSVADRLRSKTINSDNEEIIFDQAFEGDVYLAVEKISAERSGKYKFDGNISTSSASEDYIYSQRAGSVAPTFRQEVASRYERLMASLSHTDSPGNLRPHERITQIITLLNTLLPKKYEINKDSSNFVIVKKGTAEAVPFNNLSSGEIEMFTIGLDCLISVNWGHSAENVHRFLTIDEPDVHIHPDLQIQFLNFIYRLIDKYKVQVIIGTHSTTFIANIHDDIDTGIIWMHEDSNPLKAESKNESVKEVAEIIGNNFALQLLLNHKIILVEGSDDETVFNQAIKSANGELKAYVHRCGGKDEMKKIEGKIEKLLSSLCDPTEQFFVISIRDRDGSEGELEDRRFVKRYKLKCHEIENCILSDEYLTKYGKTIEGINFQGDPITSDIKSTINELSKSISNDSDWRVGVGKLIGEIFFVKDVTTRSQNTHSMVNFLGTDLINYLS